MAQGLTEDPIHCPLLVACAFPHNANFLGILVVFVLKNDWLADDASLRAQSFDERQSRARQNDIRHFCYSEVDCCNNLLAIAEFTWGAQQLLEGVAKIIAMHIACLA